MAARPPPMQKSCLVVEVADRRTWCAGWRSRSPARRRRRSAAPSASRPQSKSRKLRKRRISGSPSRQRSGNCRRASEAEVGWTAWRQRLAGWLRDRRRSARSAGRQPAWAVLLLVSRGRGGPDRAHFHGLVGCRPAEQVVVLAALLVHVGDDHGLGDVGGVRAPVAVLLKHHDGQLGIAPGHHAHEPGVRSALAALHVGVAAAHHLGGAGLAGEVDALDVGAFRRVVKPGVVAAAMPSVMVIQVSSSERHVPCRRSRGRSPAPRGGSRPGARWERPTCGRTKWPSEAMPPRARRSWMGVTCVSPWPMPTEMVLPA